MGSFEKTLLIFGMLTSSGFFIGASADGSLVVHEGTIVAGHPGTLAAGGIVENAAACDPDTPIGGLDGRWYSIAGLNGRRFLLTMDSTLDADVFFYTANCRFTGDLQGARNSVGIPEAGYVPESAEYAIVDGWIGSGAYRLAIKAESTHHNE